MKPAADMQPLRSPLQLAVIGLLLLTLFTAFIALGSWQLQRRSWKLDLIARVERQVQAEPVAAPSPEAWLAISKADEYRRLRLSGVLLNDHETLVQAVTERGAGYWVLTPLRTADGSIVLINRGFVDAEHRDPGHRGETLSSAPVTITGLLRLSEPGGGFLRHNQPVAHRWFSRDVAAMAAAQQLPAAEVAPYFVDADVATSPGPWPLGGLTVLRFHNSHLIYAITWYTLALMVAGSAALIGRQEWRLRKRRLPL